METKSGEKVREMQKVSQKCPFFNLHKGILMISLDVQDLKVLYRQLNLQIEDVSKKLRSKIAALLNKEIRMTSTGIPSRDINNHNRFSTKSNDLEESFV